jgi:hypothetical protein
MRTYFVSFILNSFFHLKSLNLDYRLCILKAHSHSLNEWRFNLSFSWVSTLFLNNWSVNSHIVRYDTNPAAIQKQHWHSREAQIEPPLFECESAFRIYRRYSLYIYNLVKLLWKFKSELVFFCAIFKPN